MSYKITRETDLLVYPMGALEIRCTRDDTDPTTVWLDICYTNTDIGIGWFTGKNLEFTDLLSQAEAYCMGYNKAIKDKEIKDKEN